MIAYHVYLYDGNEIPEINEIEIERFEGDFYHFKSEPISSPGVFFDGKAPCVSNEMGVGVFRTKGEALDFIREFFVDRVFKIIDELSKAKNRLWKFEKNLLEQ